MEYQIFDPSGLAVSQLCLGTMTFGREADESTNHAILDCFAYAATNQYLAHLSVAVAETP
jgi:aryl-alcohol dehydrogenase-like predicted oxidoreductase